MTSLALGLKLSAIKTLSAVQRAINILKSAGPGAWYDPSDIASYTAPVGPELEPALNFATWDSGGNVSTLTASSFTTTAAGGLYKAVASWSAAKYHRVRIAGTSTVAWNLRNTESGTGMVSVPAGPFNLNVVADFLKASTLGQLYIQPTGAGTVSVSSYSVVELTGLSACTMFQDSAGTTPVTAVEQPVGLILDKSQGLVLGAELVSSLDFATWGSSGVTLKSGNSFTTSGSGGCWLAVPGWSATKSYRLVISGTCTTAWNLRNADNSLNIIAVSSGAFSLNVPMTLLLQNSSGNLYFQPTGAATFTVTSISLKELPGNHAIQPTATSRPTLSSRYNLLTKTEAFDDAVWVKSISGVGVLPVVTPNAATAPDGTLTADAVTFNCPGSGASDNSLLVNTGFSKTNGVVYTGEISVKAATGSDIGKVIVLRHVAVNAAVAITLTDSWQRVPRTETSLGTGVGYFGVGLYPLLGASTGSVSVHIWGAQLVPASDAALPYQRVNTATDYDYDFAKFPPFLRFDGVDDSMYTAASVDFTSTDKMTVFAGVHKASDVAAGILVESSSAPNSTAGTFTVQAPVGAGLASFGIWSAGTTQRGADVSGATYAAPSTRVLTGVGDISGDLVVLRLNGAQVASAATDQGTGNYGNHVLYVGRRNNASFPFSGRIYQLAIKGKSLSAAEISTVESFVNSKTKAFV